ncbi:DUF1003 domain-containing protein, partial [Patescibacteria group bacterium]|nr:DUF1003 domain-containing protein [Patescibacteria group bacterium]
MDKKIKHSPQEILIRRKLHSAEVKISEGITSFAGSMPFIYVHALWFAFWIFAGQGHLKPYLPAFDPFPYGLLTMIVSLEAIFLATFIMITQNRQELEEELEEFEEEREQIEEEKEQEELEEEVEDIQKDLDDIKRSIDLIQSKVTAVEKIKINEKLVE